MNWNNHTFTWYEHIQPLFIVTETRLNNEKESWINKLKDKRSQLSMKLNEFLNRVKDFKSKDKLSDTEIFKKELEQMDLEIESFITKVNLDICTYYLIFNIYPFLNGISNLVRFGKI